MSNATKISYNQYRALLRIREAGNEGVNWEGLVTVCPDKQVSELSLRGLICIHEDTRITITPSGQRAIFDFPSDKVKKDYLQ